MGNSHVRSREDALWIKKVFKKVTVLFRLFGTVGLCNKLQTQENKRVLCYAFRNPYTMEWTAHSHLPRALADMEKHKGSLERAR